ncbi:uncharacterized protein LOC127838809 [Dreissena polymorpha]|uniref:Myb/SANT-like DNA-binding domain-containing protein n=1 Tax=Dreissena polymorpha TaxID=45954 RepID=A0A9D4FG19_DREPO|nr:uncharacterized protein LOC127838809 [Dreissena polymorpha]XP_052222763.1 uncharacterized protein LOC127838809 [Dreissena polymorpha]KAH3795986.1 hypothetical protein DPMN_149550 [Dreissena polymorpha]
MEEERAPTYSREKERHNIGIDINENIAVPKHSVAISNSINGETKAEVGSRVSEPEVRNIVQSTKYSNNENGRQLEENLKINDEDDYSRNRHDIAKGTDDKTFKYEHMNAGIDQTQAGKPSKLFEMLSREFDDDDNNKLGNYELSTNIPLTVDTEIKSEISTSPMCSPAMTSPRSMTSSPSPEISPRQLKREISESSSEDKDKSGGFDGKPKKKSRRRGSAWSDEETEFLMEIWAREVELVKGKGGDITATCAPVYRLIAQEMTGKGYDKSWEQCKTRIHTLKRAYKITKDEINSGAKTITYCRHFDKLGIICLDNPDITPGVLATTLAQKREKMEAENKTAVRTPVKRKLIVGEPPVTMIKRQKQPEAARTAVL